MEDEGLKATLLQVIKKDDDARVYETPSGERYLETSVTLADEEPLPEQLPLLLLMDADLLHAAAREPPMDANRRPLCVLYLVNSFVYLVVVLGALPLYYLRLPRALIIALMCVGCNVFALCYGALVYLHKDRDQITATVACLSVWTGAWAVVMGCASALASSTAPIVLVGLLWVQQMTGFVHVYAQGNLNSYAAPLLMCAATLVVWSLNIATYASGHDWIASVGILMTALLCVLYAARHMRLIYRQYNTSFADSVQSVLFFHAEPAVRLWSTIEQASDKWATGPE